MVVVFNDKHNILKNKVLVAGCLILNCLIIMVTLLTDRFTVKFNLIMTKFNISIHLTFQYLKL